jgi:hypothetical protein
VFTYLLQCAVFNSFITYSKLNRRSKKIFLDYIADVNKLLIPIVHDAISSYSDDFDVSPQSLPHHQHRHLRNIQDTDWIAK